MMVYFASNGFSDQFIQDFRADCSDIIVNDFQHANIIWVANNAWQQVPMWALISSNKQIIVTIHDVTFDYTSPSFQAQSMFVSVYHAPNEHIANELRKHTDRHVEVIPYQMNQAHRPSSSHTKEEFHEKPKKVTDSSQDSSFIEEKENSFSATIDFQLYRELFERVQANLNEIKRSEWPG